MLVARVKEWLRPTGDASVRLSLSIQKRQRMLARVGALVPLFRSLLVVAGTAYLLALPSPLLERGHYVSENALQPSQVNTYWNWADVHIADLYAEDVEKWNGPEWSSQRRAEAIRDAFLALGLSAATQSYNFAVGASNETLAGTNVSGILQAPKTDGAESLVLGASWLSRALDEEGNRRVNARGIATVLAVANYLKKHSMWSKDIIFLISDGYADGAHAWVDSYHGFGQTNLNAQPLPISTGPIWAALHIDYPNHSFSHAGLFYQGANGHQPNLDYVNTVSHILKSAGITPILQSDPSLAFLSPTPLSSTPLAFLDGAVTQTYWRGAKNLAHQLAIGAGGRVEGPEGVYGRYRIDSLAIFGVPADGPHGFHALGRAIESTFRSLNNLLERLHASSFLYLMTSVETFMSVGNYLAAPVLVSAGLTFTGFLLWAENGPRDAAKVLLKTSGVEMRRPKPLGKAAVAIGVTHLVGGAMFALVSRVDPTVEIPGYLPGTLGFLVAFTPLLLSLALSTPTLALVPTAPLASTIKALTLLLSGLTIAVTATLNFGLAVALSLVLTPPLLLSSSSPTSDVRTRVQQALLLATSPIGIWLVWRTVAGGSADAWMRDTIRDWAVFGTWTVPFVLIGVVPLGMQASTAALL